MGEGLLRPAAILFDVGDTLLEETRFDLEAGIRAVLPGEDARVLELAHRFRAELRLAHAGLRDFRLSTWLRDNVSKLPTRGKAGVNE